MKKPLGASPDGFTDVSLCWSVGGGTRRYRCGTATYFVTLTPTRSSRPPCSTGGACAVASGFVLLPGPFPDFETSHTITPGCDQQKGKADYEDLLTTSSTFSFPSVASRCFMISSHMYHLLKRTEDGNSNHIMIA